LHEPASTSRIASERPSRLVRRTVELGGELGQRRGAGLWCALGERRPEQAQEQRAAHLRAGSEG
jgi:hypothetical protein